MCETTIEPEDLPEAVHQIYDPELVIHTDSLDINIDGQLDITFSFNELINDPDPPVGFGGIVKVELYIKSVNPDFEFSFSQEINADTWEYNCLVEEDEIDEELTWVSYATTWHEYYLNSGLIDGGIWTLNPNDGYVAFKSNDSEEPFIDWLKMHYTYWPAAYIEEISYKTLENHSSQVGQIEI